MLTLPIFINYIVSTREQNNISLILKLLNQQMLFVMITNIYIVFRMIIIARRLEMYIIKKRLKQPQQTHLLSS